MLSDGRIGMGAGVLLEQDLLLLCETIGSTTSLCLVCLRRRADQVMPRQPQDQVSGIRLISVRRQNTLHVLVLLFASDGDIAGAKTPSISCERYSEAVITRK
jgi:hypothetical protein